MSDVAEMRVPFQTPRPVTEEFREAAEIETQTTVVSLSPERTELGTFAHNTAFIEQGQKLMQVREQDEWKPGYASFADYCDQVFGLGAAQGTRLINAAKLDNLLNAAGIERRPLSEYQARPITKLPEDQWVSAWKEVIATAPHGVINTKHIELVIESRTGQALRKFIEAPLSRGEQDALELNKVFQELLAKVADGGVYTLATLDKVPGMPQVGAANWFVRACELCPTVKVHRNYGAKGLTQYTFEKTGCVTAHARIRQLAGIIAQSQDPRSASAAAEILTLLGG